MLLITCFFTHFLIVVPSLLVYRNKTFFFFLYLQKYRLAPKVRYMQTPPVVIDPCRICKKEGMDYYNHVKECFLCPKCHDFKTNRYVHLKKCTGKSGRRHLPCICPECKKSFNRTSLARHRRDIHGIEVNMFLYFLNTKQVLFCYMVKF